MTNREFNQRIRQLQHPKSKALDPSKVKALPTVERAALTKFIIRNRGPVADIFLPDEPDWSWIHAMGYLNSTKSKTNGLNFIHTAAHTIN